MDKLERMSFKEAGNVKTPVKQSEHVRGKTPRPKSRTTSNRQRR
jgi:hypothetical protein